MGSTDYPRYTVNGGGLKMLKIYDPRWKPEYGDPEMEKYDSYSYYKDSSKSKNYVQWRPKKNYESDERLLDFIMIRG